MDQAISGIIIMLLTEAAKRIQAVPLDASQVARIRTVVAGLSLLVSAADAYFKGDLASSNALPIIGSAIATWLVAHFSYLLAIKLPGKSDVVK